MSVIKYTQIVDEIRTIVSDHTNPIKDDVNDIKNHLSKLNGQVSKNTAFRNKCENINEKVRDMSIRLDLHENFISKAEQNNKWIKGIFYLLVPVFFEMTYSIFAKLL